MSTRSYVVTSGADYLKISDDKGLTWQTIVPVGYPSIPNVVGVCADPFNSYKAFVFTATEGLWFTEDGGSTFTQSSGTAGLSFNAMYFIDSVRIIAVGQQIFRSLNSGLSFSPTGVSSASLYGSSGSSIVCNAVSFGAYAVGFINVFDKLYKTYDAGVTWIPANNDLPIAAGKAIRGIRHLNDNNTVVVSVNTDGLYLSSDGGDTFSLVLGDGPSTSTFALFGNRTNTDGWYIGGSQDIYYSPDSTVTWTVVSTYPYSTAAGQGVFAFDSFDAIIAGAGSIGSAGTAIYSTQDGGTSLILEEDYLGRLYGLSSTYEYDCGECPFKGELNPETGFCEIVTDSGPICPAGYTYNPIVGYCVGSSTAYPKDVMFVRSNAMTSIPGSYCDLSPVTDSDWNYMSNLQNAVVINFTAELGTGDIQFGIMDVSSPNLVVTQGLTSTIGDITSAICTDPTYSAGGPYPNILKGLCKAYEELTSSPTQNPAAEKIIIIYTDGSSILGGSCTIGSTTYTVSAGAYWELRNVATAIKNEGFKIILVGLGDASQLSTIYTELVNDADPVFGAIDPVPSLDEFGNLMYYTAPFEDARDLRLDVIGGITTNENYEFSGCPAGCTVYIDPDTDDAYCRCTEEYAIVPCCYELTDCNGVEASIITQTDLSDYFIENQIITIEGSTTCWQIAKLDVICPESTDVIVENFYANCENCLPSYTLHNCHDVNATINTADDLSEFVGQTIIISAYPNECWQVGPNISQSYDFQTVTIVGTSFQNCNECSKPVYQLTNCLNPEAIIITDTNLVAYLGKIVKIEGLTGLCFSVSTVECNCIKITIDGDSYTATSSTQINGRNAYFFTVNTEPLTLAWDQDDNRWSLFNNDTETLYAYSPLDVECPFTSYWIYEEGSPFTEIVVSYCVEEIFDVTVSSEFPDCDYCVNC